jgi:hypothetical protein
MNIRSSAATKRVLPVFIFSLLVNNFVFVIKFNASDYNFDSFVASMKHSDKFNRLITDFIARRDAIHPERQELLRKVAQFVKMNFSFDDEVPLLFICTHNSRRSIFAQVWAQTAAMYYGLDSVHCYSGGTGDTEVNPTVIQTFQDAGFTITTSGQTSKPVYDIQVPGIDKKVKAFSKLFSDNVNPVSGFIALMVCDDADEACPFVPGAIQRFSIPYTDPRFADNSPDEKEVYRQASVEIAVEMFYLLSVISEKNK